MKPSLTSFAFLAVLLAGCGDAPPSSGAVAVKPVDDGSQMVARGIEAQARQDLKGAAAAFKRAGEVCATNFEAQVRLALVDLELDDAAGAAAASDAAARMCPDSAEAVYARGAAAFRAKAYAKALADFTAVATERTLPDGLRSAAWSARGVVEMAQQSHDAARISLLRALRLDRRNASAHYHLGKLLHEAFHYDEAATEQFALAAGCPGVPPARARQIRGEILPALAKSSASTVAAVLGGEKRDAAAAKKLLAEGESLQKRKMSTAAARKFTAAFLADRSNEAAAQKVAQEVPKVDRSVAAVERALEAYRVLIALRPSRLANYTEAARFAYQNKRWAVAVQVMDRAVAQRPEDLPALDLLIASLKKAGKTGLQEAWSAFRAEIK